MSILRSSSKTVKVLIVFSVMFAAVVWIAHSLPTTAATPPSWDISTPDGTWTVDFTFTSPAIGVYSHSMSVTPFNRTSGLFSGTGFYNPDNSFTWDVNGTIEGDTITYHLLYTGVAAGYTLDGIGTVASDGVSMSGSFNDSQNRSGTWIATSGQATGLARLTVTKHLVPANDPGLFNLFIDATLYASNVGDSGSTGPVTVEAGVHAVSETAGTGTILNG